ncbi:hypothetical protein S83_038675 [Arachis hypogaea]
MRIEGVWYVVCRGRIPGIYPNSETAAAQVDGFPRNLLLHYRSYQEALNAWNDYFQVNASPLTELGSELLPASGFNQLVRSGRHDSTLTTTPPVPGLGSELPPPSEFNRFVVQGERHNTTVRNSPVAEPGASASQSIEDIQRVVASIEYRISQMEIERQELRTQLGEIIRQLAEVLLDR